MSPQESLAGCLVGTAVGDSVGLPAEGLGPARIRRRLPGTWRQRLIGHVGMCSDDTEHALFVAQSMLKHPDDPGRFQRRLAWCLRAWLLALPAGVGFATGRACIKLWLGWAPHRAGVWSAGNGPAMRAPIIGACFHDRPEARRAYVEASTRLTHTDPRALTGALAVAEVAAWMRTSSSDPAALLDTVEAMRADDAEWRGSMAQVRAALGEGCAVSELASRLGLEGGITGYVNHTVPMVIFTVLRHLDAPAEGLQALWSCGGDTDTTGAIAGGLLGIRHGEEGFPEGWRAGIHNGPLSLDVLRRAGAALARPGGMPVRWMWPLVPIRNAIFLVIVLGHGFRRLLP